MLAPDGRPEAQMSLPKRGDRPVDAWERRQVHSPPERSQQTMQHPWRALTDTQMAVRAPGRCDCPE